MFWLFAQMFVLCGFAFLAGAVLTWLPLRATIRTLRTELSLTPARPTTRPALPPATVVIPTQPKPEPEPEPGAEAETEPGTAAETEPGAEPPLEVTLEVAPEVAKVVVKGSSKSMIFHTPDSPYFKRMKGDVTFHSVAEAERAGYTQWRPKTAAAQAR